MERYTRPNRLQQGALNNQVKKRLAQYSEMLSTLSSHQSFPHFARIEFSDGEQEASSSIAEVDADLWEALKASSASLTPRPLAPPPIESYLTMLDPLFLSSLFSFPSSPSPSRAAAVAVAGESDGAVAVAGNDAGGAAGGVSRGGGASEGLEIVGSDVDVDVAIDGNDSGVSAGDAVEGIANGDAVINGVEDTTIAAIADTAAGDEDKVMTKGEEEGGEGGEEGEEGEELNKDNEKRMVINQVKLKEVKAVLRKAIVQERCYWQRMIEVSVSRVRAEMELLLNEQKSEMLKETEAKIAFMSGKMINRTQHSARYGVEVILKFRQGKDTTPVALKFPTTTSSSSAAAAMPTTSTHTTSTETSEKKGSSSRFIILRSKSGSSMADLTNDLICHGDKVTFKRLGSKRQFMCMNLTEKGAEVYMGEGVHAGTAFKEWIIESDQKGEIAWGAPISLRHSLYGKWLSLITNDRMVSLGGVEDPTDAGARWELLKGILDEL